MIPRFLRRPPVDFTPTGDRVFDFVLNVIDGIEIAVLLVAFMVLGKKPKDWGEPHDDR
jgi:hypothetical protein